MIKKLFHYLTGGAFKASFQSLTKSLRTTVIKLEKLAEDKLKEAEAHAAAILHHNAQAADKKSEAATAQTAAGKIADLIGK